MRDSVELQAELNCALGTFEEATNGRYDSGVPSNGMKPTHPQLFYCHLRSEFR